jgi:hypothetical protein
VATKRKATRKRAAGSPIIIDGGGKKKRGKVQGNVKVKFRPIEWNFDTGTGAITSRNVGDSIKRLFIKAGTLEFVLSVSEYDEIRIRFD